MSAYGSGLAALPLVVVPITATAPAIALRNLWLER
jgi:hypothetical protein